MNKEFWDGVEYAPPHKPTIILISGKAQHGKDTVANILQEKLKGRIAITRYAKHIKEMYKTYYGWNGVKNEKAREFLQWLGTDFIRAKYPNWHVDRTRGEIEILEDEFDYFLIPDVRFPNELLRNTDFNIKRIRIIRTNYESELTEAQQNHISETALDDYDNWDLVITADSGDIASIRKQLEGLCTR